MGDADEEQPQSPAQRRRAGLVLLLILAAFSIYDVIGMLDLARNGSTEEIDHASERIGDLSTGPNAP